MTTVNMHEAKTQLSKLVEAAERGETVIIARNGHPAAKLTGIHLQASTQWPDLIQNLPGEYDPDAFDLGRDDLGPSPERDLF